MHAAPCCAVPCCRKAHASAAATTASAELLNQRIAAAGGFAFQLRLPRMGNRWWPHQAHTANRLENPTGSAGATAWPAAASGSTDQPTGHQRLSGQHLQTLPRQLQWAPEQPITLRWIAKARSPIQAVVVFGGRRCRHRLGCHTAAERSACPGPAASIVAETPQTVPEVSCRPIPQRLSS